MWLRLLLLLLLSDSLVGNVVLLINLLPPCLFGGKCREKVGERLESILSREQGYARVVVIVYRLAGRRRRRRLF